LFKEKRIREELKLYLEVYALKKKGLTIREIISEIGKPAEKEKALYNDPEYKTVEDMYRVYLKKAKRIIKNTERGDFPGRY